MLRAFTRTEPKPFKPIPFPYPNRKPCSSECNDQLQSAFFSKLPAEIRNIIYEYVFSSPTPEWLAFPDLSPHPLSALLTCHKLNHEATNLAFHHHTFPIDNKKENGAFYVFQVRTAHLSTKQLSAISSVSVGRLPEYSTVFASIFANAMTVFPNLKKFEIRMIRTQERFHKMKGSLGLRSYEEFYQDDWEEWVVKFVPDWFKEDILNEMMRNHAFKWQGKRQWDLDWPQEYSHYFDLVEEFDRDLFPTLVSRMNPEAAGKVRGVEMCDCGCQQIIWTAVDLVEADTLRKVAVEVVLHGRPDAYMSLDIETLHRKIWGFNAIILKPGVVPLQTYEGPQLGDARNASGCESTGIAYEADEEYWEAIRRRNWDIGALARYWWKGLTTKPNKSDDPFPGSKFHGQGDWARLNEMTANHSADEDTTEKDPEETRRNIRKWSGANQSSSGAMSHERWIGSANSAADLPKHDVNEDLTAAAKEAYQNRDNKW